MSEIRLTSHWVLLTAVICTVTANMSVAQDAHWDATFSIAKNGAPIRLPVQLNDTIYQFLLDTSASNHCFDTSLSADLAKSANNTVVRGSLSMPVSAACVPTPDAQVGSYPLSKSDPSALLDLTAVREGIGEDVYGILAPKFLLGRVVQIDFDQGKMCVAQRFEGLNRLGEAVSMRIDSRGCPWVETVNAGGRVESFCIATSLGHAVSVHKWLFDLLVADGSIVPKGTLEMLTIGGVRKFRWGRLSTLTVGHLAHHDIVTIEGNKNLLGLDFLARHIVTFDLSRRKLYLKAGDRFNAPYTIDTTGLHLAQVERGAYVVAGVDKNSRAAKAGIIADDRITRVDQRSCQDISLLELRRILKDSNGNTVTIVVNRNGKERSFQVDADDEPTLRAAPSANIE